MFVEYTVRKLVNIGTKEKPTFKAGFFQKRLICCNQDAIERAKCESYNGRYRIVYSGGERL